MGKNFVKGVVKNPSRFFERIDNLHKYKLITNSSKRNIKFHFETHEKRIMMRNVISSFANINPNLDQIVRHIKKYKISPLREDAGSSSVATNL